VLGDRHTLEAEKFGRGRTLLLYQSRRREPSHRVAFLTPLAVALLVALIAGECAWRGAGAAEGDAAPGAEAISGPVLVVAPLPTVTPAPAYTATAEPVRAGPSSRGADTVERWRPLVEQYTDWDANLALRVLACESHGENVPNAQGSGAAGLFQLLGWEAKAVELYGLGASVWTPSVNVGVAHWIWSAEGGFGTSVGWRASQSCWMQGGW
jgi:hypothetical protein